MKLVASLIVRNEMARFLDPCITSLREFCDEVRVLDDHSDDGTFAWLQRQPRVEAIRVGSEQAFFNHEGRARQRLLDWTMEGNPTHILVLDADEFVPDGQAVRDAVSGDGQAWSLTMQEIWKADESGLSIRQDGGWWAHPVPVIYRPSGQHDRLFHINDRQLACGREPLSVRHLAARGKAPLVGEIQHWGWTRESSRQSRYDRYAEHDGGNYHAKRHLDSILWSDEQVSLSHVPWPDSMLPLKAQLLAKVNG